MKKWRAYPTRAGRSYRKRYEQLLPAASVTLLMAGCAPYWAASGDAFVEYSGSDRGKVQACADFSAGSEHGASTEIPLYEVVTDIQVEPADVASIHVRRASASRADAEPALCIQSSGRRSVRVTGSND